MDTEVALHCRDHSTCTHKYERQKTPKSDKFLYVCNVHYILEKNNFKEFVYITERRISAKACVWQALGAGQYHGAITGKHFKPYDFYVSQVIFLLFNMWKSPYWLEVTSACTCKWTKSCEI